MRLSDVIAQAVNPVFARVRRDAIAYALCAICGVAAIVFAASATVLALEPHVGVVYARLILAGVFALVLIATIITLRVSRPRTKPVALSAAAPQAQAQRSAQFTQLAMIVEAMLLGYTMSRRR